MSHLALKIIILSFVIIFSSARLSNSSALCMMSLWHETCWLSSCISQLLFFFFFPPLLVVSPEYGGDSGSAPSADSKHLLPFFAAGGEQRAAEKWEASLVPPC